MQQLYDEVLSVRKRLVPPFFARKCDRLVLNVLEELKFRLTLEWRIPAHQKVGYYPDRPDVTLLRIIALQHLGRHVLFCAGKRLQRHIFSFPEGEVLLDSHAEVNQFNLAEFLAFL